MMDDNVTAETLLSEIQSESLQQLLTSVRHATSPAGSTRIAALDAFLYDTLVRPSHNTSIGCKPSLSRGDVIEVQGPAASGKTHVLYHLLITCISPHEYHTVRMEGWGKAALLLDTDNSFDILRFHRLLVSHLTRQLEQGYSSWTGHVHQPSLPDLAEELASICLQNLHVFQPNSSPQLATTLLNLPKYHATHPYLHKLDIGILAIDSMSAFYWKDRYDVEQSRESGQGDLSSLNPLRHVLAALQAFRVSHGPVIIMTNWGLNPLRKPAPTGEPTSMFFKQHLYPFPAPFDRHDSSSHIPASTNPPSQHSVAPDARPLTALAPPPGIALDAMQEHRSLPLTCHITLRPVPVSPFAPTLTLSELEGNEPLRAQLVKAGRVQGLVRVPGTPRVGEFTILIRDDEVVSETQ